MEFVDELKKFSERILSLRNTISTEEATKMSMIVPFFQILGYDVFNPNEFCPEYTADVGIKKGEKIDYAIILDGKPEIFVECKWCGDVLDKHGSQLFRYFVTSEVKFAILTNGIVYKFFTDLDKENTMDLTPFLEIDMSNLKDAYTSELRKFCKDLFDKEGIFSTASDLKYSNLIKDFLKNESENPSDEFARLILSSVYDGQKNQKVIDKFKPLIKKSFTSFINDTVNQRIASALSSDSTEEDAPVVPITESKIITSQEEIESFYIIRGILAGTTLIENIVHRDTESYFSILFQDNNRKPICRMNLDTKKKSIMIPDDNKGFERFPLESINDIYKYKDQLISVVNRYI